MAAATLGATLEEALVEYSFVPADVEESVMVFLPVNGAEEAQADEATRVVAVLDYSSSMQDSIRGSDKTKVRSAVDAVGKFVNHMRTGDHFTLLIFHHRVREIFAGVITSASRAVIHRHLQQLLSVESMTRMGSTDLWGAIESGLEAAAHNVPGTTVIIFSDGNPTSGMTDPDQITTATADKMQYLTYVTGHFVAFGSDVCSSLGQSVAEALRGNYVYVNNEDSLVEALALLSASRCTSAYNVKMSWELVQGEAVVTRVRGGVEDVNKVCTTGVADLVHMLQGSKRGVACEVLVKAVPPGDEPQAVHLRCSLTGRNADGMELPQQTVLAIIERGDLSPICEAANDERARIDCADAATQATAAAVAYRREDGKKILVKAKLIILASPAGVAQLPNALDANIVLQTLIEQYKSDTSLHAAGGVNCSRIVGSSGSRMNTRTFLIFAACAH